MIAALGLSTFKYETVGISLLITSRGQLQNILAIFDTVARTEDSVTVSQQGIWNQGSKAKNGVG